MNPNKEINAEKCMKAIDKAGLGYIELNNGYHLKISAWDIDLWPTTQRWQVKGGKIKGDNIESLLDYIKQSPNKNNNKLSIEQMFNIAKKVKPLNLERVCEALHKEIYK